MRRRLTFTAEPAFRGSLALVVGVVQKPDGPIPAAQVRPLGGDGNLVGHFHAAAFSFRPFKKGRLVLGETVRTLVRRHRRAGRAAPAERQPPGRGRRPERVHARRVLDWGHRRMTLLIGALTVGLILSLLALGVFISFRIFEFPDITADGSITLGRGGGGRAARSRRAPGRSPPRRRFCRATIAGALTGIIHTRFGINGLLSGILVMTALYSINLHVMGRSNVPLLEVRTLATQAEHARRVAVRLDRGPAHLGLGRRAARRRDAGRWRWSSRRSWALLIYVFFRTNLGTAMQAAGDNPQMIRALGVNVENMVVLGLAVSNGLVALSGALLAQYQGFADVQMGIGMVVWGLASIIIGEALVGVRQLGPDHHRRGDGLGALPPAGGDCAARRPQSQRPEAGDGRLRVPGPDPARTGHAAEQRQAQASGGGVGSAMLAINTIRKTFNPDTPNEVRALQGVNLALDEGSFVVVIGTNGSGKSTLLNALAGSFIVDEGSIVLDGTDITRWPEHRRAKFIGRVFQNPFSGTAPRMTIAENLALAARRGQPRGLGWALKASVRQQLRERVSHLRLGLEDRLDNSIGSLSGGQRQALTLLMASWLRPRLLLLDEHTAALDPRMADHVINLSEEIVSRDKLTTLMVTHSMQQAANLGDRLIMMHRGSVLHDFSGAEKQRLRPADLLARFESVRRAELLDESAAEMLRRAYV